MYSNGYSDVAIENGTAEGFSDGTVLIGGSGNRVQDITATDNDYAGVLLEGGSGNTANDVMTTGNSPFGALLVRGSGNTVEGTTVTGSEVGVFLFSGSGNKAEGIMATGNQFGVLVEGGSDNTVSGSSAIDNGVPADNGNGITIEEASGTIVARNVANENGYAGVNVAGGANTTLEQNAANGNAVEGIIVQKDTGLVSRTKLTDNTADNNSGPGIVAFGASQADLSGNTANNNKPGPGIIVFRASETDVTGNTSDDNGGEEGLGFELYEASQTTPGSNTSDGNSVDGLGVFLSANTTITGQTANKNLGEGIGVGVFGSYPSSHTSIADSGADENGEAGIRAIGDPDLSITGTATDGNQDDGIKAEVEAFSIEDSVANSNGGDGILLLPGTVTATLTNTRTDSNRGHGIEASPGVVSSSGATAGGNGTLPQCVNVVCSWGAEPETQPALSITTTSVTLYGIVDPHEENTTCVFQYGTAPAYGDSVPCNGQSGPVEGNVGFVATVSGLEPETEYDYRIVARSAAGTVYGENESFTTAGTSSAIPGAAPQVTNVNPDFGPQSGGTTVAITGTGFSDASAVKFGSMPAASFKVNSGSSITATAPQGKGTLDVYVTTPGGGKSTASPEDEFVYLSAPPPMITKISPNRGPAAGGTTVTITGSGFGEGTPVVKFGSVRASIVSASASTLTVTSPPGEKRVAVSVQTANGTTAMSTKDRFRYTRR